MKIISKFKDYYDFLQGIYGIDEKIIYERHCERKDVGQKDWEKAGVYKPMHIQVYQEGPDFFPIAVCGTIHCVYKYKHKFFFGEQVEALPKKIQEKLGLSSWYHFSSHIGKIHTLKYHLEPTKINEQENCPVVLLNSTWSQPEVYIKNPKLADFGFASYIEPQVLYLQVSNFLSREKPIVDKRTNLEKIISHGFDKKTSFRNVK